MERTSWYSVRMKRNLWQKQVQHLEPVVPATVPTVAPQAQTTPAVEAVSESSASEFVAEGDLVEVHLSELLTWLPDQTNLILFQLVILLKKAKPWLSLKL